MVEKHWAIQSICVDVLTDSRRHVAINRVCTGLPVVVGTESMKMGN